MNGGIAESASFVVFEDFGKLKILGFLIQNCEIQLLSAVGPDAVHDALDAVVFGDRVPYRNEATVGQLFGTKR